MSTLIVILTLSTGQQIIAEKREEQYVCPSVLLPNSTGMNLHILTSSAKGALDPISLNKSLILFEVEANSELKRLFTEVMGKFRAAQSGIILPKLEVNSNPRKK